MVLLRTSFRHTTRLTSRSLKLTRSPARMRSWQQVHRRAYASGENHSSGQEHGKGEDHGHHQAGSDLPWLIGSIVFTVPSAWYLWPEPRKSHGHGHDEHKEHEEGHEESEDHGEGQTSKNEEIGDGLVEKRGEEDNDNSDESESDRERETDTPETTDDEDDNFPHETGGGGDVEGVQFKGATKGGTREGEQGDTRKHIPDPKGYSKKKIESDYGKPQGVAQDEDDTSQEPGNEKDKPAAAKPPGGVGLQSGKQEGLSNTDTKHSTNIDNDPEKPTKPEGPETSKAKGTIDPGRPQA